MMRVTLLVLVLIGGTLVTGGLEAGEERPTHTYPFLPVLKLPTVASGDPVATSDFRGTRLLLVEFASW